jgi:hypothetical protein
MGWNCTLCVQVAVLLAVDQIVGPDEVAAGLGFALAALAAVADEARADLGKAGQAEGAVLESLGRRGGTRPSAHSASGSARRTRCVATVRPGGPRNPVDERFLAA